jgi:hypothetical protein
MYVHKELKALWEILSLLYKNSLDLHIYHQNRDHIGIYVGRNIGTNFSKIYCHDRYYNAVNTKPK